MADYFTQTVIQPTIPTTDITPLERLLLSEIFSAEPHGEGLYFFAEDNPALMLALDRDELAAALAASRTYTSSANTHVAEQLSSLPVDEDAIDLDLSGTSWEFIFQDIVRRSKSLRYVTAVTSFTCSKMRPDGFGGMAVLITADEIMGKSTHEILGDFLSETGLDGDAPATSEAGGEPSGTPVPPPPADPRAANRERAEKAANVLRRYQRMTACDYEDSLCDLLCDLMHNADRDNFDFETALLRARGHYDAETP
jgi:hypothetical protein